MDNTRGISTAFCVFLFVLAALLCSAGPARAQADPVTLLESFPADQRPAIVASVNGKAIYADTTAGKLYATDGTPGGAAELSAVDSSLASLKAAYMVYEKSPAFIVANQIVGVPMGDAFLWKTDGTPEGTTLLKRAAPTDSGTYDKYHSFQLIGPLAKDMLFADLWENGVDLWKTDGTPEGTVLLKRVSSYERPPVQKNTVGQSLVLDGRCYFLVVNELIGGMGVVSLACATDGTPEGTAQLGNDNIGGRAGGLFALNGQACWLTGGDWIANSKTVDSAWFVKLGQTPATTSLPVLLSAVADGAFMSDAVAILGDRLLFMDGYGTLFTSDGTDEGTQPITAHGAGGQTVPAELGTTGKQGYFGARSADFSWGLWRTDGTAVGTSLVMTIPPGVLGTDFQLISRLQATEGILYFMSQTGVAQGWQGDLWRSDGTPGGTSLLCNLVPAQFSLSWGWLQSADLDGVLYFTRRDTEHGMELWRSSGTPETTVLCEDIVAGPTDTQLSTPALVGRNVIFTGLNPAKDGQGGGFGLWSMPHPFSIVPNLVGTVGDQALVALQKVNLAPGSMGAQYDAAIPKDAVVSQSVAAGARVPRATVVDLVVSLGPEPVVEGEGEPQVEGEPQLEGEPQIEGEPQLEGEPALEGETQIEGEPSHEGEVSQVEGESHTEGETGQEGECIPQLAIVPNLAGTDEDDAQTALASAGLVAGNVTRAYSDSVPMSGVVSQEPPAGARASAGSKVDFVVSLGPEPSGCPGGAKSRGGWALHLWELLFSCTALSFVSAFRKHF